MVVNLLLLLVSWLLLWLVYKKHLEAIGVIPTGKRLKQFLIGFVITAACCNLYFLLAAFIANDNWKLNESITIGKSLYGFWWIFNSVLFEELVFRGALLYIAIRLIGRTKAVLLSAFLFAIFHWFNLGIWGNLVPMIYIFVLTFIWGIMFALSFVWTQSLYLPIGLHLGWNLFNILVYSSGPLGKQILTLVETKTHNEINLGWSIFLLIIQVLLAPALLYFYRNRLRPAKSSTII